MKAHAGWMETFASSKKQMQRDWLSFLGKDNRFPREVMTPSTYAPGGRRRVVLPNPTEFVDLVTHVAPRADVWVGSRPVHEYYNDSPTHTRLWLEIDAGENDGYDLELARLRAQAVRYWCVELFGVRPYEQFSANKGFHLHLDHPPVSAQPEQLRTALRDLFRDVGLDPEVDVDLNVAGNTRAMPRPPYTMNTGGAGRLGECFFTVPIDLDWSIERILEASRGVELGRVVIPFASRAGPILQDAVGDTLAVEKREANPAQIDRVVKEVVIFLNQVAPHVRDGRKRILRHLAIPAYLHSEGSDSGAREAIRRFLEKGGADWSTYRTYVEGMIRSAHLHDGRILYPMRVRRFLVKNPDVLRSIGRQ